MGIVSNLKGSRTQEGLPVSDGLPPSSTSVSHKKKCSNLLPLVVALVVIAEISFLGRLDMAKNAAFFDSWPDMFYKSHSSDGVAVSGVDIEIEALGGDQNGVAQNCEQWLEREDAVEWKTCAVGCKFGFDPSKKPDAAFGLSQEPGVATVLRSMESALYYSENNIAQARRWEGL
ncbi:glycoprotein 3-alpha-L-fucosyltransferase A-like isoform X2 [Gossypium australe]|uniref:Glycoprotein 3-alpha-L-fucosyltransferase A-like isoform X2 n=1 Tax=Gossypium australe TaxID=47621 RepID=A0A5B6X4M1_9ROSI|nr:glycoprotein 3-alpha-L-fucosyltransferase A-like isoform X2 [Gossypium australe]